jgi:hypothetical protein
VDQQQPTIDASAPALTIGGVTDAQLAQMISLGSSDVLAAVALAAYCTSGDLTVEVQSVTPQGAPSGQVLTSQLVPGVSLPPFISAPFVRTVWFTHPVSLDAGSPFALVLRSYGACASYQGPTGDPYPGGSAYFRYDSASWSSLTPRSDLPFQALVEQAYEEDDGHHDEEGLRVYASCFIDALLRSVHPWSAWARAAPTTHADIVGRREYPSQEVEGVLGRFWQRAREATRPYREFIEASFGLGRREEFPERRAGSGQ